MRAFRKTLFPRVRERVGDRASKRVSGVEPASEASSAKRAVQSEQCETSSAKQANEASEVANGGVSGLILMSVFLVVPDHSALFSVTCPGATDFLLAPFPLALPFPLLHARMAKMETKGQSRRVRRLFPVAWMSWRKQKAWFVPWMRLCLNQTT